MKKLNAVLLMLLLGIPPVNAHAAMLDSEHLQSLGEIEYMDLHSRGLGRSFHVFVDLPERYADTTDHYPTIYLLDGGNTFPLMAAHHHYLRFGDETPAAILVGISYGADTHAEGNMRQTDFTAPAEEREFWGGAGAFQQMLAEELLPLVESRYRADTSRRILFGHSLGGQFVLYSALTRPDLFSGHIASSPVLHLNLPFFRKWRGGGDAPGPVTRLFVSSGELEANRFRRPVEAWSGHWQSQECLPWHLKVRTLHGQTHFSATPEAFRQGLDWLFTGQAALPPDGNRPPAHPK